MSRSFTVFLRRNLAAARLAVLNQIEYRANFLIDALLQPLVSSGIEVTIWSAILSGTGSGTFGGFPRESYLAYALWATFLGRLTANWMYEFMMMSDIETGSVNALLMRPISFYEYYLSQFVGYKCATAVISLLIPIVVCLGLGLPFEILRLPAALLLTLYYLVFVHTLSFTVATCAFFLNRAQAFTGIKNLLTWVLAGELVPLDLYPEPFRHWLTNLPFSAGVYMPVGYLTGRISTEMFLHAFSNVTTGLIVIGLVAHLWWRQGLKSYTGTGA